MHGSATSPSKLDQQAASSTVRQTVFRVLETAKDHDTASRLIDVALILLISASVLAVILESMPSFENKHAETLAMFEGITVAAFSVEYLLRLWSCVERSARSRQQPFFARIRFMVSFHAIVDLLAILPFYLLMFSTFGAMDMRFLRAIRLLRVLKLTRYSSALNMLFATFRENGRALLAAFLILLTVMLLAASGMYYFERDAQPEDFGSIPAAMWWAFATLTTVGYGDVTPITVGGKVFGALIAVVGIGMVALPTSILATGYSRQLKLSADEYQDKTREALDDGVLTDDEKRDLESLRLDLGISKNTASQILDAGQVEQALRGVEDSRICPHCRETISP